MAAGGFASWVDDTPAFIYGRMEDVSLEDQRRLFDLVYWGIVHGTLAASRHLRHRGGAIVNVGSVLGDRAIAQQAPCCAAKGAVKNATDAFRMEFEGEGLPISVILVEPGPADTPFMEHARIAMGTPGTRNPPPAYHPRVAARAILQAGAGEPRPGARLPGARRHALVDDAGGAHRLPRPRGSAAGAADPGERRASGVDAWGTRNGGGRPG